MRGLYPYSSPLREVAGGGQTRGAWLAKVLQAFIFACWLAVEVWAGGTLAGLLSTAWGLPMNFSILALPNKQLLWAKKLEPETTQHASQIQLSHFYWTVQIGSNTQIWPWLITAVEWESSWDGLEFILREASTWRGLSVLSYVESPLKLLPAIKKYFYQHTKKIYFHQ